MIPKYKDSQIPFIGQIPCEWEILRNKNLFFLDKKFVGNRFSEYQLLSLTKNGVIEKDLEDISGKQPESYDTYQAVKKGTLIMCLFDLDCSAVFSGISKFDGMISPAYKIMHGNEKVHMGYYDYLFWHIARDRSYKTFSKNVRYTISDDEFGWIKTICPSVIEQKVIADFLDEECGKIDSIVADMESQVEILKGYRKSLINEVIVKGGGIKRRLKDLFIFGRGAGISKEFMQEEGLTCIHYGGIHFAYGFSVDPEKNEVWCVDEIWAKTSPNSLLRRGDFLFADTSEDIEGSGNFTYYNSDEPAIAGQGCIVLRAREKVVSRYIAYQFDSLTFRWQIQTQVFGVKVFHPTQAIIKSCKMIVPPLDEQQAIADYLDEECAKIDAIIKDKQAAVDIMREYKKSLIYEYVTGKKRVREAQ